MTTREVSVQPRSCGVAISSVTAEIASCGKLHRARMTQEERANEISVQRIGVFCAARA
jgi:hypothetical protein